MRNSPTIGGNNMSFQIIPNVYSVGVKDPELAKFDIVVPTHGTTYNSYLIVGEKIALVDTVKEEFFQEFLANIQSIIDPAKIDYIITQHSEPDHTGSLKKLLTVATNAVVVLSIPGSKFIRQQLNEEFPHKIVTDQKTLRFITAPFLHWADVIFTYLEEDQVLFSCDAFASHFPETDQHKTQLEPDFTLYYQAIMAPFAPHIQKAVAKVIDLPIKIIGPSHGPILIDHPKDYILKYKEMSEPVEVSPYVVVAYASAYGYTKSLAYSIINELSPLIEVKVFDIEKDSRSEIVASINNSKAVLLGSPTFNQDAIEPVWFLMASLSAIINKRKPAAAFGSYGWSGEAVEMMSQRLKGLKFDVLPGVRAQFAPTPEDLAKAQELARLVLAKIQPN